MSRLFQLCLLIISTITVQCIFLADQGGLAKAQESDKKYQKSIGEIGRKINNISRNLNANKTLVASERDKLLAAEKNLYSVNQALQKLDYDLAKNQHQYDALSLQVTRVIESQKNNSEALRVLINSRYLQAKPDPIKQLLNQENPYAVGRLTNYNTYFSRALKKRFKSLASKAGELAALKQKQSEIIVKLDFERQEKFKLQTSFEKSKQLRAVSIVKLEKKIETNSELLEKLKNDRKRLESLLRQLKVQAAELKRIEQLRARQEAEKHQQLAAIAAKPQRSKPGKVISRLPVKGGFLKQRGRLSYPVKGKLTRHFGSRLVESGMSSEGVFFNTTGSVSVTSIFRGRVIFADFLKGYGLLIIIDHGDNHISLYGHNDRLLKQVGDIVATGETIANSGMTGGLKSHGLYFEIRENATPIDASNWCE